MINVKEEPYGASGDGVTDDSTSIQNAISFVSASIGGTVLFPPGIYRVSRDINSPNNVALKFLNGAVLNIDSSVKFTINGILDANAHQTFSGLGAPIVDGALDLIPEWFGFIGDGSTDNSMAFDRLIFGIKGKMKPTSIRFHGSGIYHVSEPKTIEVNNITILGNFSEIVFTHDPQKYSSFNITKLFKGAGTGICNIRDLIFSYNRTSGSISSGYGMVLLNSYDDVEVKNVHVRQSDNMGIHIDKSGNIIVENCHIGGKIGSFLFGVELDPAIDMGISVDNALRNIRGRLSISEDVPTIVEKEGCKWRIVDFEQTYMIIREIVDGNEMLNLWEWHRTDSIDGTGIWITDPVGKNVSLIGNNIEDTYDDGIFVGHGSQADQVVVMGNIIHDCGAAPIKIAARRASIVGNTLFNTNSVGILVRELEGHDSNYSIIAGNTISSIGDKPTGAGNNMQRHGIWLRGVCHVLVAENNINKVLDSGIRLGSGIQTDCVIQNNNIKCCNKMGIELTTGGFKLYPETGICEGAGYFKDIVIRKNLIKNIPIAVGYENNNPCDKSDNIIVENNHIDKIKEGGDVFYFKDLFDEDIKTTNVKIWNNIVELQGTKHYYKTDSINYVFDRNIKLDDYKHCARALYDFSIHGNGEKGLHNKHTITLDSIIPKDSYILQAWYEVLEKLTSEGDARIALGIESQQDCIKEATRYDDSAFDPGLHDGIPVNTAEYASAKTTTEQKLQIAVCDGELTSGKIVVWAEYVQSVYIADMESPGRTIGCVRIHEIDNEGRIGAERDFRTWSNGWATATPYNVGENHFLLLLRAFSGEIQIYKINRDGTIGNEVEGYNWCSRWTTVNLYTIRSETYLFLLKESNGHVHIHNMNSDGTVGTEVERHDWGAGWTTSTFYTIGLKTYLFLLKASNGRVHIYEMNNDGSVGVEVERHDWSAGWTTATFYTIGSKTYLFLIKSSNGHVHIHEMNNDGSVGVEVERHDWSSGWTTATFYSVESETYLFLIKASNGSVHIHKMNIDGSVGPEVERVEWDSGWSTVAFSLSTPLPYLISVNRNAG